MNTREKINSYSISEDGKSLNFLMGDIAIMRFEKVDNGIVKNKKTALFSGTRRF